MLFIPTSTLHRVSVSTRSTYGQISRFVSPSSTHVTRARPRPRKRLENHLKPLIHERRALHQDTKLSKHTIQPADKTHLIKFKKFLIFPKATHEISPALDQLRESRGSNVPEVEVVLHGYLGTSAVLSKNLYFVNLTGKRLDCSIQIISSVKSANEEHGLKSVESESAHNRLKGFPPNTPVAVRGKLKDRVVVADQKFGAVKQIKTIEVELIDVQSLNDFPPDIVVTPDTAFPPEQRHLQIRYNKDLRNALHFRAKVAALCRDQLSRNGFTEVETPLLFKSTPEGAREFIVPTRRKGLAYALPQSPQQFKQVLMASGISKYYQIAKCFRDEGFRADRQPEFTQLDLEMSFATGSDVMSCIEVLITRLWKDLLQVDFSGPFPILTYEQAMSDFGSDKPDTRLGMPISRMEHLLPADLIHKITSLTDPIVEAMLLPLSDSSSPADTRKFIGKFLNSTEAASFNANLEGGPGIFVYDSGKPLQGLQPFGFEAAEEVERAFGTQDGDLIVLQARKNAAFTGGSTPLGNLRLALHGAAVSQGFLDAPKGFEPLWITDFPLFSPISASEPGQGGNAGLASTHHPFTSPKAPEDVDLLTTDPLRVLGEHYDLVMNGVELGGGSRRIHNAKMQEFVMRDVLKMSSERIAEFSHLLEVLRAGCPPHAGIALGFDRLVAVMLGRASVRDVIAFPKSGKGEDMLVKSPSMMNKEVLETYHIQLRE